MPGSSFTNFLKWVSAGLALYYISYKNLKIVSSGYRRIKLLEQGFKLLHYFHLLHLLAPKAQLRSLRDQVYEQICHIHIPQSHQ